MMEIISNSPVPYIQVNREFHILAASPSAQELCAEATSFIDCIDEGSKEKARQFLQPGYSRLKLELNLLAADGQLHLVEVFQSWEAQGTVGHLVCMEKQERLHDIQYAVQELREQIADMEQQARDSEHSGGKKPLRLAASAPTKASREPDGNEERTREIQLAVDTAKELIKVLRPDLIEAGKDMYVDLILNQLDHILDAI